MLPQLNFPAYTFKIVEKDQNNYIFDKIRRKYVNLTPEEWVRQHVIQYLIREKFYAAPLIGIEQGFRLHNMQKRSDAVVYNHQGEPAMLIECKAPSVKINNKTLQQASAYNLQLNAPYLLLTNGLQHYCIHINPRTNTLKTLNQIPEFQELINK